MKTNMDIDMLIEESIQNSINNGPNPLLSSEEAWNKISRALNEDSSKTNRFSMFSPFIDKKTVFIASISLVIISALFFYPQSSSAFGTIAQFFQKTQGTVSNLFVKVAEPDNDKATPDNSEFAIVEGSGLSTLQVSLTEAKKMSAFTIKTPKYVPENVILENVTLLKNNNESKSKNIYLNYIGQEKSFTINQMFFTESMGAGKVVDNQDTKIEKIYLFDREAMLLTYKNKMVELYWVEQNNYFSIQGKITKEEIINIAKSMY